MAFVLKRDMQMSLNKSFSESIFCPHIQKPNSSKNFQPTLADSQLPAQRSLTRERPATSHTKTYARDHGASIYGAGDSSSSCAPTLLRHCGQRQSLTQETLVRGRNQQMCWQTAFRKCKDSAVWKEVVVDQGKLQLVRVIRGS